MSSYLDISERIKATDRDTGLHKEDGKKNSGKVKLCLEQITNAMAKELPSGMESLKGKGLKS